MGSYAQRGFAPLGRAAQPVRRRDPNRVPDDHLDSKRGRLDSGGRNLADLPVWNYLPVLRPQHIFDLEPEGFGWFCGFVAIAAAYQAITTAAADPIFAVIWLTWAVMRSEERRVGRESRCASR